MLKGNKKDEHDRCSMRMRRFPYRFNQFSLNKEGMYRWRTQ